MSADLKSYLASLKGDWKKSKVEFDTMFGGEKLPAATYLAKLVKCFPKITESSGRMRVNRQWLILEGGEHEGVHTWDGINVDGKGLAFLRRFIDQCEYNPPDEENPEELLEVLAAIEAEQPVFKIKVVHNGDFVNMNILSKEDDPTAGGTGEGEGDADTQTGEGEGEAEQAPEGSGEGEGNSADQLDELTEQVRAFVMAQMPEEQVQDTDDLDTLKALIVQYEFKAEEMDQTEIELLNSIGMAARIKYPAPAPKPAKAPAAKAPAPKPAAPAPTKPSAPSGKAPAKPAAPAAKGPSKKAK